MVAMTSTHSHLNSTTRVLALPSSSRSYARQVVSLVNIHSSLYYNQNHHYNKYIQFSSRLSTFQSRPVTNILPSRKQFSCRSSYTHNCSTSLEEEEEEEDDYKNNNEIANRPSSNDRMGGSLLASSSLSSGTRSCSCNCQNTSPSIQINIVFPHTLQLGFSPIITMLGPLFTKLNCLVQELLYGSGIFFQVAVLDKDRALRRTLNKIAKNADASTLYDPKYVFKEVVKALLHYNDSSFHFTNLCTLHNLMMYTRKPLEEILKRELDGHDKYENALVNVDEQVEYNDKGGTVIADTNTQNDQYTVLTVFVLANGEHTIPLIEEKEKGGSYHDSIQVLRILRRIPKSSLESVKVLWSPRRDDVVLLEDELQRDFPSLKRIKNGRIFMDV